MSTRSRWLLSALLALLLTPAAWAQAPGATALPTPYDVKPERKEIRRDRRQIRRDRREIKRDRGDARGDRKDVRADPKDIVEERPKLQADRAAGDDAAPQADLKELAQDRRDPPDDGAGPQ